MLRLWDELCRVHHSHVDRAEHPQVNGTEHQEGEQDAALPYEAYATRIDGVPAAQTSTAEEDVIVMLARTSISPALPAPAAAVSCELRKRPLMNPHLMHAFTKGRAFSSGCAHAMARSKVWPTATDGASSAAGPVLAKLLYGQDVKLEQWPGAFGTITRAWEWVDPDPIETNGGYLHVFNADSAFIGGFHFNQTQLCVDLCAVLHTLILPSDRAVSSLAHPPEGCCTMAALEDNNISEWMESKE
jgi:hypothetical protein